MTNAAIIYEDGWGEVIDRPSPGYVEIRWYDTTAAMTQSEFQDWLSGFAGAVESALRPGVLVDATSFRMAAAGMDDGWRYENIIPRYNAAGVKRFAFHMPEGMPAIGAPPAADGPADFPTAYFATRADAVAWLSS